MTIDGSELIKNFPDAVWIFDQETLRFRDVNAAAVAKYGYSRAEFLTMSIMDIRPSDSFDAVRQTVADLSQSRHESGPWIHRTKSGQTISVIVSSMPIQFEDRKCRIVVARDVSGLIQVQHRERDLAERLAATLERMSDALFTLDHDWIFSFVNSEAERILNKDRQDLIGRNIWAEYPSARGSTFEEECSKAMNEGKVVRFTHFHPEPLNRWIAANAVPTRDGIAVYFRDVTALRARDEQLSLLEASVARINDILLITEAEPIDAPGGPKIVYVNDAFVRRTGFSRAEAIGARPSILQGPKTDRAELDRIRSALIGWQPVRSELVNYTKDGQEFWLELDIVPIANSAGWYTHWVAIERDISERKEAERELKLNEERFRLFAMAAGSAIWEWDILRGRQWWSDGLRDIFGHETDAGEAIPTIWRDNVHSDDAARLAAALDDLEAGRNDAFREHYRFRRADGTWATVEDVAFAVRDVDGQVTRVLGSMTDISEKLLLEERLRQAQKMEAVGQLTGGLAHDFNNLLTVIMGNAELLLERLSDSPELLRLATMTAEAADRGAELTNRLLAFSRKQALQPRVVDVAHVIQGMDALLRRTLPETVEIEVIRASGLWRTEIDVAQLETALLNLAVNARDAMPNGGRLTIEMANAALDDDYVQSEPDVRIGHYVLLAVTDTGTGIARDIIDHVFEPFFTTKPVGKGSGMGLSMVYGFAKQSGGHVRIYSEQGEGTVVKLYFPRSLGAKEEMETQRQPIAPGGSEKILVVEDDAIVREYVLGQLRQLGYRTVGVGSGRDAMEILRRSDDVDLLFTDVVMPGGMGGRELANHAQELYPLLKILFTSGYTENSIVHDGRLDPGVALLGKPYSREKLALKIRSVLDKT